MKNSLTPLLTLVVTLCIIDTRAQNFNPATLYNSYYYDYKLANPAFTGSNGKHVITTMYSGLNYPTSFNSKEVNRTAYASYEGRIDKFNTALGGRGVLNSFGAYDFSGAGLFYSRKIPLSENSGLKLGAQLVYQRLVIDYSKFRFLSPGYDPLITGTSTESSLLLDAGVAYYSPVVTVGIAAKNLVHDANNNDGINVIITRKFDLRNDLKLTPSLFYETDFDNSIVHLNGTAEIKKWLLLGGGYTIRDGKDDLSFNIGLNVLGWAQIITHVYSSINQRLKDQVEAGYIETVIRVRIPGTSD